MARKSKKGMSSEEKILLKRDAELKYSSDRLGAGSLMTQQSHINASRMIMVNHNFPQHVSIKEPEASLVPSGFENALAEYNDMNEQTDGDFKVVAKFEKSPYTYILIGYDENRRLYTAWKREELEEHSEGCATRFNNKYIDSLEIGNTIPSGTFIKKSESFDKNMNYQYGKNLNTVYMISTLVYEDGITLMNGAENMMNTFRSKTVTVPLSENEVLLNWYGDDKHYQGIPNVGEKVRAGYVAITRQLDGTKSPYALKAKHLRTPERGDRPIYGEGRVIDIDIRYNGPRSKLVESAPNMQIIKLYDEQQEYYTKLYTYMQDIVDRAPLEGYSYTDDFSIICMEAFDYVDAATFFADSHDTIYGNMQINIQIMPEVPILVGTKLVGRYGNKGVVNRIIPKEKSWHMEDGRPIHAVVAALGIVGRVNQAQLNEAAINDAAYTAVQAIKNTDSYDTKAKIMYRLMRYLNSDEADKFKKFYRNMKPKEKEKFFRWVENNGIVIVQHPIDNANILDIEKAYEEFPPNLQHIVFPDGGKSMYKVICSKMFFIRLKQDPIEKYSARSLGPVNPLTSTPAKSNRKKKNLEAISDVPVRIGEQEIEVLLTMVNHPAAIADFMAENSTSFYAKMTIALLNYLGYNDTVDGVLDDEMEELYDLGELSDMEIATAFESNFKSAMENAWINGSEKKSAEQIMAYLNELQSRIVIETETAPDGEMYED